MDERDQELLDKQLRRIVPSARSHGVMILAILAMFFGGMALGGFMFGYENEPTRTRIASNNPFPAIPAPRPLPTLPQ